MYNNSSTIKMMRLVCRPSRNNLDDTATTDIDCWILRREGAWKSIAFIGKGMMIAIDGMGMEGKG